MVVGLLVVVVELMVVDGVVVVVVVFRLVVLRGTLRVVVVHGFLVVFGRLMVDGLRGREVQKRRVVSGAAVDGLALPDTRGQSFHLEPIGTQLVAMFDQTCPSGQGCIL